eukprot:gene11887-14040_t
MVGWKTSGMPDSDGVSNMQESEVGFSDLSVDGFNNPEYTAAYKESMAAEAQVTSSNVEIISVVNPQEGMVRRRRLLRRLLQSNTLATAPASAPSEAFPDGETGVSEEVTGALGPAPSPSQNAVTCVVESEILILKQSPVLETFIATLETNVTAIFQNESIFQNITETSKVHWAMESAFSIGEIKWCKVLMMKTEMSTGGLAFLLHSKMSRRDSHLMRTHLK